MLFTLYNLKLERCVLFVLVYPLNFFWKCTVFKFFYSDNSSLFCTLCSFSSSSHSRKKRYRVHKKKEKRKVKSKLFLIWTHEQLWRVVNNFQIFIHELVPFKFAFMHCLIRLSSQFFNHLNLKFGMFECIYKSQREKTEKKVSSLRGRRCFQLPTDSQSIN